VRWLRNFGAKILLFLAVGLARLTSGLSRLLAKGKGSSLPGMVALCICPGVLKALAGQVRRGIVMVTGTNGKTTTNNMIAQIAAGAGYQVAANLEGANLITGVTAALLKNATLSGRLNCDYACLEVDEASFPLVCAQLRPDIVVVTNFFRDQLDRYGELDNTIRYVRDALEKLPSGKLVLNADDPLVAQLQTAGTGKRVVFYGFGEKPAHQEEGKGKEDGEQGVREARFCPFCGFPLAYAYYQYGQLGNYRCPRCAFARPKAGVEAVRIRTAGSTSCLVLSPEGPVPLTLPVSGLYNLYNALAAFATGLLVGVRAKEIGSALQNYTPVTGRMERYHYLGKAILLNLVKNPAGFNESLGVFREAEGRLDVLIAINDNAADGRDISWLWDVDFEVLQHCHRQINCFVCSGTRAEEMGVRLKYAGVPLDKIIVEPDLEAAVDRILRAPGHQAYLLATYTALWPVERKLARCCQKEHAYAENMLSVS